MSAVRRGLRRFVTAAVALPLLSVSFAAESPRGAAVPADVSPDRVATELLWSGFAKLPAAERPHVILVLGGGGARGLAHIGVLKVFEQERIPVDEVVGVSVGALIGALYAGGLNADQIDSMAQDIGWNELTDFSKVSMMKMILSDELLSTKRMESYLNRHIGARLFSDLRIPFTCVATDLRTGERIIFREGPVAIAARASATIPAIFAPVAYRQRSLVDGGLVDNLPTDVVDARKGDVIVAVLPRAELKSEEVNTIFKSLVRSLDIQKDVILEAKRKTADFLIEPDVGTISLIDLGRSRECIEAGVSAARARALDLKKLILQRYNAARTAPAVAETPGEKRP